MFYKIINYIVYKSKTHTLGKGNVITITDTLKQRKKKSAFLQSQAIVDNAAVCPINWAILQQPKQRYGVISSFMTRTGKLLTMQMRHLQRSPRESCLSNSRTRAFSASNVVTAESSVILKQMTKSGLAEFLETFR